MEVNKDNSIIIERSKDYLFNNGYSTTKLPYGYSYEMINNYKIGVPNSQSNNVINIFEDYQTLDEDGKRVYGYLKLSKMYLISKMTIKNILKNPFYCGYVCRTINNTKQYLKGKHKAIITTEQFLSLDINQNFKTILK